MLKAIKLGRAKTPFDLWAYVIMPEHVHLVLLPKENATVSAILTTIKQSVSKRAIHWLKQNSPEYLNNLKDSQPNGKEHYRFWQRGGGYDRNLRSVRDIHEKIRYIHQNPVRRGLVKKTVDWKWSSVTAWKTGLDELIAIDRLSVPSLTSMDDDTLSDLLS